MGTPEFAAGILQSLVASCYKVVGVVTRPDKPAGRGRKVQTSAVKQLSDTYHIPVLQPEKLSDTSFLAQLRAWEADLFVVVAFRMLPEAVWGMPPRGTFNLHASLLPQYRGAAPINWAIINGERETGVTTFFIDHEIDTGNIIFFEKTSIDENENAGTLHDKLMGIGARLVLKTIGCIADNTAHSTPQPVIGELKSAPKIYKETGKINWHNTAQCIHNLVRGLSPFPAAFSEFYREGTTKIPVKIFETIPEIIAHDCEIGSIVCNGRDLLKVACADGFLHIKTLQLAGKKRMTIKDFLSGFRDIAQYRFI